ncbi:hypothetical protein EVAR_78065_1 [Eumeta japonica]|uniref:Uncharacterized protein n=1 Tax=Eumeta variegata TaxID=151549 RepID=A0A4C1T136_EUMVA|nr:hypothetical protein EVAR_78065_1 [Eumeta japonica]
MGAGGSLYPRGSGLQSKKPLSRSTPETDSCLAILTLKPDIQPGALLRKSRNRLRFRNRFGLTMELPNFQLRYQTLKANHGQSVFHENINKFKHG